MIVIENKLSAATDYTVRQKEGWKKLANGNSLEVKSPISGKDANGNNINLVAGDTFSSDKVKPFKISDHGETDVSNVDISPVQVSTYKNYKYTPRE